MLENIYNRIAELAAAEMLLHGETRRWQNLNDILAEMDDYITEMEELCDD